MSCPTTSDAIFKQRVKDSQVITNLTSNISWLHKEAYCLRVPDTAQDQHIELGKCSSTLQVYPKLSDNTTNYTDTKVYDNLFFHDSGTKMLYSMREFNGCIKVDPFTDEVLFTKTGCNGNQNQQFYYNDNFKQFVSVSTGKCFTAPDFVADSTAMYLINKKTPEEPPARRIKLGQCPNKDLVKVTAYDDTGNSLFQFGQNTEYTGTFYDNVLLNLKNYMATATEDISTLKSTWQSKYDKMKDDLTGSLNLEIGLYNAQVAQNGVLQQEIVNNKKRSYQLIVAQTDEILRAVQTLRDGNFTEHKSNEYQLQQNIQIQYSHKILFWVYFAVAFLFMLILVLQYSTLSWVLILVGIVVAVVYPFLILFIEYGLSFLYYYLGALVYGTPFIFNKLPPTSSVFYTP